MKTMRRNFALVILLVMIFALAMPVTAFADDAAEAPAVEAAVAAAESSVLSSKASASAIAIGLAAAGGALAMGICIAKSVEGISRQPEAEGKIRTTLMLGLVFVETAIIYALVIAILIIFVL